VSTTEVVDHGVGFSEELFAVALAEQEDEAVKVGSELVDVVAAMPDEGDEAVSEGLVLAARDPVGEEGEEFGELDGVAEVEVDVRHPGQPGRRRRGG